MKKNDVISATEINKHFSPFAKRMVKDIFVFDSVSSTQSLAKEDRAGVCNLYISDQQTDGRGRNGRPWFSQNGSQVLLSLIWCFPNIPKHMSALSLVLAVELAAVLEDIAVTNVALKWPNDIFLNKAKLAGMLVDAETSRGCSVVIGLGLNVLLPEALKEQYHAADLSHLEQVSRNSLVASIVSRWCFALNEFSTAGFGPWLERYNTLALYVNQRVRVSHQSQKNEDIIATYEGVADDGCLLLRLDSGESIKIWDSEWSLRPVDD